MCILYFTFRRNSYIEVPFQENMSDNPQMEKGTRTTISFPASDEFCGLLITLQKCVRTDRNSILICIQTMRHSDSVPDFLNLKVSKLKTSQ